MSITINGSGDINATGNDIELNSTGTTDVTLALGGGNVGIGTATPSAPLQVQGSAGEVRLQRPTSTQADWSLKLPSSGGELTFYDNNNTAERARIDSSGNLFVGKTTTGVGNYGFAARGVDGVEIARDGGIPLFINRGTSDGTIIDLRKDGSTVGNIGVSSSDQLFISRSTGSQGIKFRNSGAVPCNADGSDSDNDQDLGISTVRWDDVYATNGTIQTSDANEKQDVAELDEAEKRVATAAKGLIRKFRWIDSVEAKGDDARIHVGILAQDLKAAFEAEGLDPGRYAMFISSTWWESDETYTDDEGVEQTRTNTYQTSEEAPEGAVERTRLGVRYNQLLAFIIGAL